MSEAKRLTDLMIERLRVGSGERSIVWDRAEAGMGLRAGSKRKAFVLKIRVGKKQLMTTLGAFPAMNVAEARAAARAMKKRTEAGEPLVKDASSAVGPKTTVQDAIERYVERQALPNQRSWRDTARLLRGDLAAACGDKALAFTRRSDVLRALDLARQRGVGRGANRLLAHCKRFFAWCAEQGAIDASPAAGVRPPMKEQPRDRTLEIGEIAAVWRAALTMGFPYGDAIRLLLLTGQRRDEVGRMRWADVDQRRALWTIPASRNKSGRAHLVPLSTGALAILETAPASDAHVFWGRAPNIAVNGWSVAKRRLDALAEVDGWRLHDLRRTAATGMARLGFDPHVVERVLGHATSAAGPLAQVYQRWGYEDEKREALEAWSEEIAQIVREDAT